MEEEMGLGGVMEGETGAPENGGGGEKNKGGRGSEEKRKEEIAGARGGLNNVRRGVVKRNRR
jgi:hypothetical protein